MDVVRVSCVDAPASRRCIALAGCAANFQEARTPSGDFCAEMPILVAGQDPGRPYQRVGLVTSGEGIPDDAHRLEALRRAACKLGADAVIEAASQQRGVGPDGKARLVSEGFAVVWAK
jgi:hypothetical protein